MKKIIALIIILTLSVMMAFTACNKNNDNTNSSQGSGISSGQNVSGSSVSETDEYTIIVEGGTGGGKYERGASVTVTANVPAGKMFSKWVSDGEVISTKNPYTFSASKDITLTAVFEDEPVIDIHADAKVVSEPWYNFDFEEGLENFSSSDKALVFDYKAVDSVSNTGNGFQFTLWGSGWTGPRRTELITVNVVDNTVSTGNVKALEDGWYRVIIPANELPVNSGEGATGEETLGSFIVNIIDHAFMIDEAGFFDIDSGDIMYKITVKNGSGGGEYARGTEVTAVANEIAGKTFKEWQVNGKKVSESSSYTFTVKGNINLIAVYSSEEDILANSVLVVGDVHLGKEEVCKTNLIKTLQYVKNSERIKVVLFNGDTVDLATEANYTLLDECFESVFGNVPKADRPEFLFNMGNHEFYPTSNCDLNETVYEREFGLFRNFANKWMSEPIGENENVYMRTIGGISYIIAFPGNSQYASIGEYLSADFAALSACLSGAAAEGRPCVLATHWPWGYTYGGPTYGMANGYIIKNMTDLLKQYPSVINVTSHTHFSDLHERTLDQTYYTTVNIGTHCLGKHVNGVEQDENGETVTYLNLNGHKINSSVDPTAHKLYWSGDVHFGIGMDFGDESVTIKRINIGKGEDYAHGVWTLPYGITTENYHDKFVYEKGERSGETLTFAEDATLSAEITSTDSDKATIALGFTDVEQYYAVEGYKIEVYNTENELVCKKWWQSLFWVGLEKKSSYTITLTEVPVSEGYTVKVYPMDFFGHYNEPITATIGETEPPVNELAEYTKTVYVEDGKDFVILNLTDYQLHDGKSTYTSFAIIDELVEEYDPDFITVLGDTAEDNGNYTTTKNFKAFVDYIDALGIPWAPIYGNHDNDNYRETHSIKDVTSTWINNTFTSAENCLFSVGPDSVSGNGNYIVNVVNSTTGKIVKSLYFFDSGTSGVESSHVAFYENAVDYSKTLNGGDTPESIVFLHIPLPEYRVLYDNEDFGGIAGETPHAHGTSAFFAKIKELGSTTHVICGHDHKNSFYGQYEGVYLMYCLKSSDGDYFDNLQLGGTVFKIGAETTFEYHYVDAKFEIISKQNFNTPEVDDFINSGKAFTFDYKPTESEINTGNTISFAFWEGDNGWGKRVTDIVTIDVVNDTVVSGIGEIIDIGDGWRRLTINCGEMPINTGDGATGEESVRMMYFNEVNHAFLLDNMGFVGGTPILKKYNVKVVHGSGSGTYHEGDEVTVTAEEIEGRTFVEWQAGGVRVSTDNPYTFTVTGKIKLTAVYDPPILPSKVYLEPGFEIDIPDYDPETAGTLEFDAYASDNGAPYSEIKFKLVDIDGNYFGTYTISYVGLNKGYNHAGVESTKIATQTYHIVMDLAMLSGGSSTAPGKLISIVDNGSSTLGTSWIDNIEIKAATAKYTVTVEGGAGSGIYNEGSKVTVTASAPSGKSFVEWRIDGVKVSETIAYTFTVTGDVTLTAIFEDADPAATKVMLSPGFEIALPDYDASDVTTLELDVYLANTSARVGFGLYDANGKYFGTYRLSYTGLQNYNKIGVTCESIGENTYHVTWVLDQLSGGSSTAPSGKLIAIKDLDCKSLDGCWIDNIEFK